MFYIINDTDCPCVRLLVYMLPDGSGKYLNKKIRPQYHFSAQQMANATSLDTFGFSIKISDITGRFNFCQTTRSKAKYTDGKPRQWQDKDFFSFSIGELIDGTNED